ncbi:MAG: hypothetical protein JWO91_1813 [Acidobacteriaceae bacterium]|nr:hypothetical protein [Acidobacteriaceae bacterium]
MQKLIKDPTLFRANRERLSPMSWGVCAKGLWILFLAATMLLCSCGGGSSSVSQIPVTLSGNWQFTVANPADRSFSGGIQGGFLVQKNRSVTGGVAFSVSLPGQSGGSSTVCGSGSAPVTGTLSGQNVTLTAVAGAQTFVFTGVLDLSGSIMAGTYTSSDGAGCGTAQTDLQWSATLVPPLFGTIQGSFNSLGGSAGLSNQLFPVTGTINQGDNVGGSSATITGTLNFFDPITLLGDYPCLTTPTFTGQISGNSVILQIIGADGSNLGQIGGSVGSALSAVTFDLMPSGGVLHSAGSPAYAVNTKTCAGVGLSNAGDFGNLCLGVGSSKACQQPTVTISPKFLTFSAQSSSSPPTTQTISLTNSSSSAINGLQLQWDTSMNLNGLPNFTETDNCAASIGLSFSLAPGQFCTAQISFTPQQSCVPGVPTSSCLTATLSVLSPLAENDYQDENDYLDDIDYSVVPVPITGPGLGSTSAMGSKVPFAADGASERTPLQRLSFTNHREHPVQSLTGSGYRNFEDVRHNADID